MKYSDHYGNDITPGEFVYCIGPGRGGISGTRMLIPYDMKPFNPEKTFLYPFFVLRGNMREYIDNVNRCNYSEEYPNVITQKYYKTWP